MVVAKKYLVISVYTICLFVYLFILEPYSEDFKYP